MKAYTRTIDQNDEPKAISRITSKDAAAGIETDDGHRAQITVFRHMPDRPDTMQLQVLDHEDNLLLEVVHPIPDRTPIVTASGQAFETAQKLTKTVQELMPGRQDLISMAQEAESLILKINDAANNR